MRKQGVRVWVVAVFLIGLCVSWFPSTAHGQWRSLRPIKIGEKWGFQDTATKQTVIEPQFDHVCTGVFLQSEGDLIPASINGKWGFVNEFGSVVEPQFDFVNWFSEGLAAVNLGGKLSILPRAMESCLVIGGKWGYIDKTGEVVIQPGFDKAYIFSEGLAAIAIGDEWDYIDRTGKIVIPPQFDGADRFSEGLAKVQITKKWGFVSNKGKIVIAAQFDGAEDFSEGLAAVQVGEKWGYVNKAGETVIKPDFRWASGFYRGQAFVQNSEEKATRIDRTGASNENWEYLGGGDNTFFYYDQKRITHPSKNVGRGWIKLLSEPNDESLDLWEADCSTNKIRTMSIVSYDSHGKVVHSTDSASDWQHVVPDSMGEVMYKLLCPSKTIPAAEKKRPTKK